METIFKAIAINLCIFLAYAVVLDYATKNDWEGFALIMYFIFCIGLHILINIGFTFWAKTKKKDSYKFYLTGTFTSMFFALAMTYFLT